MSSLIKSCNPDSGSSLKIVLSFVLVLFLDFLNIFISIGLIVIANAFRVSEYLG
jgi:hypothetical protein